MANLPSGTVTFLFTDIEGSTRLVQQLGEEYPALLAEHQRILREACEKHNGTVVSTQGDSFFVAFPRAKDAIHAAVESQQALAAREWTNSVRVMVRMGLHTGEPQVDGLDYSGIDVHRAARIAAAAHGGQVLLSQTTHDLAESQLPAGVTLRDLGEHRLKDLRLPKHLYQLVITDLPSDFPELKSLSGSLQNLPVQLTSFVGRSKEIDELKKLLENGRLLTLTGPGGTGKTRLALQVAAEVAGNYSDGAAFVGLASISDPALVASTIAQSSGITETPGRSIIENIKDHLHKKSFLLLLDNFEQVMPAASLVAELLSACSKLHILVTSREPLHLHGELEYPVPPLALPNLTQLPTPAALSQYAAVELFIQRARAVKPNYEITNETAPAVAEICHRLNGLPLAIELAAARIKLLPPQAMLARLEHRLEFLTGGARDLPARQQTLRNTIAWSYDLLNENEQKLFWQLSVFVGGCTLDSVGAVVEDNATPVSVLDQLGSLLDKSLLREVEDTNGEPRFLMLEILREFGLEKLEMSGEAETIRHRHANFFLTLAEQSETGSDGAQQVEWMNRMEQEHDNLRAALEWSRLTGNTVELCLRLAAALGKFWEVRGYFSEGRDRLSSILSAERARGRTAGRASLLARAAELAYRQSDYPATILFAGESLDICREIGDRQGIASALIKLGNAATESGDYATASGYLDEAKTIWHELNDKHGSARALISSGFNALRSGDYHLANIRLEEALSLSRQLGDTRSMGFELSGLGEVALRQGNYARAAQLVEESLTLRRRLGNKWGVGVSLGMLGWIAIFEGDWNQAFSRLEESLELRREIGDKGGSAWSLERLAEVALAQGKAEKAVRLIGAAAALREAIRSVIDSADKMEYEGKLATLRSELGDERFEAAWEEGLAMPLEQAAIYALES